MSPTDLRSIRTFPSLVKYLRDELDWPIETDDFDDLTFDYRPEELGIDPKTAAKIEEIKQLRPLVANQPWGIFFIKFEPKRLPVVVLRRILRTLVIKKRASASKSHQATWNLHDLLFISSYGESDHRDITFAHFTEDDQLGDLPALRVLGWDDEDTVLHLEHAHKVLREKLRWPSDPHQADEWGEQWSSAFTLRHMEVITTSKDLAIQLARLATAIRKRVSKVLSIETESGPLHRLMKSFKKALIHDLYEEAFADMYAQTITYGLLSARVSRPAALVAENITDMVPTTNPFLKDLLSTFLTVGGRKGNIDFDELGINEVVHALRDANMEAILRDFGDRNPQEDPVIHFYELFLKEYNPKLRMQRGVFYTPRPVVSFIVRSVDEILRTEFGLEDGLADITTWGEMPKRNPEMKLQKDTKPEEPFVQILDPALGTGTFLVEVIHIIHKTMTEKWLKAGHLKNTRQQLWNEYVPKHLLPRLYGFELLMAPYAIAHMKIGLKLWETGYRFCSDERTHIYLTNSLEPPQDFSDQFEFMAPVLAHEAQAVNEVKRALAATVIIGNPPYAVEGVNQNQWINDLLAKYKEAVRNEQNIQLLSDDYVKFIRYAHFLISRAQQGIIGMITKNTYINTTAFRGLRESIQTEFSSLALLNLHGKLYGKTPSGAPDENVFEIRVGVAILFATRSNSNAISSFKYADIFGSSEEKLNLLPQLIYSTVPWRTVPVDRKCWVLEPILFGDAEREYSAFIPLLELFTSGQGKKEQGRTWGGGVKTNRDFLLVAFSKSELERRLELLASTKVTDSEVKRQLNLVDSDYWNTSRERGKLRSLDWRRRIFKYCYGPFDIRWIAHIPQLIEIGRGGAVKHLMRHYQERQALGLVLKRRNLDSEYRHVFLTRNTVDINCLGGQTYTIPSEFADNLGKLAQTVINSLGMSNLTNGIVKLREALGEKFEIPTAKCFHYIYAILHSPTYRTRYAGELRKEFPRIPLTNQCKLFIRLCQIGGDLTALHLLEDEYPGASWNITGSRVHSPLKIPRTTFAGTGEAMVDKGYPKYNSGNVFINLSRWFEGVPEDVWKFYIGGYQVCQKWLKDRKDRCLSEGDISHYHKIVVAINETIRLMAEIDEVIEKHGGWPGAFTTSKTNETI